MLFAELDSGQCGYFCLSCHRRQSSLLLNENQKETRQQATDRTGIRQNEADNGLDLIFEGYSCLVKCHQRGSYEY